MKAESLVWEKTEGGAWKSGPYHVVERVDNLGWNAAALFESDAREGHERNFYCDIGQKFEGPEEAKDACAEADHNIRAALAF